MTPWTDAEIKRYQLRVQMFVQRGWDRQMSEQWAETLLRRDRHGDQRRICQECSELQQDGKCFPARQGWMYGISRRFEPVLDVLQRCGWFKWAKPRSETR